MLGLELSVLVKWTFEPAEGEGELLLYLKIEADRFFPLSKLD